MRMKKSACAAAAALLILAGCYEPTNLTFHQPAKYKGPEDPLLAKQRSADQQEILLKRFKLVQTDR